MEVEKAPKEWMEWPTEVKGKLGDLIPVSAMDQLVSIPPGNDRPLEVNYGGGTIYIAGKEFQRKGRRVEGDYTVYAYKYKRVNNEGKEEEWELRIGIRKDGGDVYIEIENDKGESYTYRPKDGRLASYQVKVEGELSASPPVIGLFVPPGADKYVKLSELSGRDVPFKR